MPEKPPNYSPRVVDSELREYLQGTRAISIEGARGVGKTATGRNIAASALYLDDPDTRSVLKANRTAQLSELPPPVLVDEWQLDPPVWDAVRRLVDDDPVPGRFVLTGSTNPRHTHVHTGAGRVIRVRMRPMTLLERGVGTPTVSLAALLGGQAVVAGTSDVDLNDYIDQLLASGFPGLRGESPRTRARSLTDYVEYAAREEVPQLGTTIRQPATLLHWLQAYAAATSGTAAFQAIANAVQRGTPPTRVTVNEYREVLEQLWLLDEVPAWSGSPVHLAQLGRAPKHHLADPALAAALLGANATALLRHSSEADTETRMRSLRSDPLLGALFESLATLSVRVFAQPLDLEVSHLRTHRGAHEIDLMLTARDGRILPIEVKLSQTPSEHDLRHLRWLRREMGTHIVDAVVLTTGSTAYRTADGIAVVPLALLGP